MPLVSFAQRELREVLGCFATGVAVVTTCGEYSRPVGLAVYSFSPLSPDPPEILWSIVPKASSRGAFVSHGAFAAYDMLEEGEIRVQRFARPSDNKFDGVALHRGWREVPVLDTAIATSECEVSQTNCCRDHHMVIGFVRAIDSRGGIPLVYFRDQFTSFGAAA